MNGPVLPRLIATEEAFAPVEYIEAFLKLTRSLDTAGSRYVAIYYKKAQMVRELTDLDCRLDEMDRLGVDMHLLGMTSPGVQAFDATPGTELAILADDTLARAIRGAPLDAAAMRKVEGAQRRRRRAAFLHPLPTRGGGRGEGTAGHGARVEVPFPGPSPRGEGGRKEGKASR